MSDFERTYRDAQAAFDAGKYIEAHALFHRLLADDQKEYAEIHNKLGIIACHQGDLKQGVSHFEKALDINPHYTEASLNLTIAYNDIGEYDKAVGIFSRAAEKVHAEKDTIDPFILGKLANEHAHLGQLYLDFGLLDDAEEQYRKALSMRPDFVDVLTSLGIVLREKGLFDDAIGNFLKAKKIKPDYTRAMIHLGITYYMKGFTDLALEEWETIQRVCPDGKAAEVYLALAKKEIIDKNEPLPPSDS
ncbi:MAG: tetratricopeptide repeat protein [Nitrospiria bacterium]